MVDKMTKSNHSIEKTFQLIDIMADYNGEIRLSELSKLSGIPQSTALRLLNTMLKCGYVNQSPKTQKYALSLKFARIGSLVASQYSIREVAREDLVALSLLLKESACLAIADEDSGEMVYIDTVDGPDNMLKTLQRIGKRAPIYCTGVGKCAMLSHSYEKVRDILGKKPMLKLTQHTITDADAYIHELRQVAEQGYALDNEECEIGARCIAAPIWDYEGKVVAAISVSGPVTRISMEVVEQMKKSVSSAAKSISAKMGFEGQ